MPYISKIYIILPIIGNFSYLKWLIFFNIVLSVVRTWKEHSFSQKSPIVPYMFTVLLVERNFRFRSFEDSSCMHAVAVAYNGDSLQSQRKTHAEKCVSCFGRWGPFFFSWYLDLLFIFLQSRPNGYNSGGMERKQSLKI